MQVGLWMFFFENNKDASAIVSWWIIDYAWLEICYAIWKVLDNFETFPPIHSFIHSRIYKAPLQEIYSEAPQPNHGDTD